MNKLLDCVLVGVMVFAVAFIGLPFLLACMVTLVKFLEWAFEGDAATHTVIHLSFWLALVLSVFSAIVAGTVDKE